MAMVFTTAMHATMTPDTEFKKLVAEPTEEQMQKVSDAKSGIVKHLQGATTLVLSTKVSWWNCNHHIGQGRAGAFHSTVTGKAFRAASNATVMAWLSTKLTSRSWRMHWDTRSAPATCWLRGRSSPAIRR
eukprot:1791491-Amphidinium_carterae.1